MVIVTYQLVEKKKKTVDNPQVSDNTSKTTIHLHSRSIDAILETVKQAPGQLQLEGPLKQYEPYRSYSVKETLTEGQDGRDRIVVGSRIGHFGQPMTQEEVEKFEQDWSNLWNPQAKLELDWKSPNHGTNEQSLHLLTYFYEIE